MKIHEHPWKSMKIHENPWGFPVNFPFYQSNDYWKIRVGCTMVWWPSKSGITWGKNGEITQFQCSMAGKNGDVQNSWFSWRFFRRLCSSRGYVKDNITPRRMINLRTFWKLVKKKTGCNVQAFLCIFWCSKCPTFSAFTSWEILIWNGDRFLGGGSTGGGRAICTRYNIELLHFQRY